MVIGADLEIHGLEAAKGPLDLGEPFVATMGGNFGPETPAPSLRWDCHEETNEITLDDGRGGDAEIGDEQPMTTIQRIVYATDLSSISEPAWPEAKQLGRLFGAEILLVHVVPPLPVLPTKANLPELYDELIQSARREAEVGFDRLLGSAAGSGLKVRIRLEDGAPAQRILELAAENGRRVV